MTSAITTVGNPAPTNCVNNPHSIHCKFCGGTADTLFSGMHPSKRALAYSHWLKLQHTSNIRYFVISTSPAPPRVLKCLHHHYRQSKLPSPAAGKQSKTKKSLSSFVETKTKVLGVVRHWVTTEENVLRCDNVLMCITGKLSYSKQNKRFLFLKM